LPLQGPSSTTRLCGCKQALLGVCRGRQVEWAGGAQGTTVVLWPTTLSAGTGEVQCKGLNFFVSSVSRCDQKAKTKSFALQKRIVEMAGAANETKIDVRLHV